MKDLEQMKLNMDSDLRKAIEMAAHEIAVKVFERYCEVRNGCLPLDETAIAHVFYRHVGATSYLERSMTGT